MTSILDNDSTMRQISHNCGGTILSGPDHAYCDRCGAVAYFGDDMTATDWVAAVAQVMEFGPNESNLD